MLDLCKNHVRALSFEESVKELGKLMELRENLKTILASCAGVNMDSLDDEVRIGEFIGRENSFWLTSWLAFVR